MPSSRTTSTLIESSASTLVDTLWAEKFTPFDLLDALEERIGEVDGEVNALPTLCFDRARQHAARLMKKPVEQRGRLAGMPVPIKDLVEVEGVRTTHGSPIYADHVPKESDILVENLEREGGVIYAKSATTRSSAQPSIPGAAQLERLLDLDTARPIEPRTPSAA